MSVQGLKRKRTSVSPHPKKRDPPLLHASPAIPKLSNELVARIVDYLHNDTRSLKSCSLASHSFLARARHSLFEIVHLNLRTCRKFLDILETSPGVGPYVKEVHIAVSPRETPPWVDKHLPAISAKLPNVLRLYIGGQAVYKAAPLIGFSSIREMHILACEIESTNAFLTLLGSFPQLETMYTNEMCVYRDADPSADDGPPVSKRPPNLKSITFNSSRGDANKAMNWLVSRSFCQTLERYTACPFQDIGLKAAGPLVKACGPVLKQFKLGLVAMKTQGGFGDIFGSEEFSLAKNTNLVTLELCSPAALAKLYGADDVSFDWFPLILAQVSSPYIEEVGFYLWEEDLDQLSTSPWTRIVDLLASPQFSSLRKIAFHVWGNEEATSQITENVKQKFTRLADRGILRFDSTPDPACV